MAQDAKKHETLAVAEKPTRAALARAILSVNDAVPAATRTEQQQIVASLAGGDFPVSAARPLLTSRADAPGLHRLEITTGDGVYLPVSGVLRFASVTEANTFADKSSALLAVGDRSIIAGAEYRWTGTAWALVSPGKWADVGVFGGGFNHYRATGWSGVQYMVQNDMAFINGAAINANAWSEGAAMCNVPAGARPSIKYQGVNCQVLPDGNVLAGNSGSGAISFSAAFPISRV